MKRYSGFRDSKVEWIGKIPESWSVIKIKHVSNFSNGYAYSSDEWAESGFPVIRMSNISETGKLNMTHNNTKYISKESAQKTESFKLCKNDVLVAMTDMSSRMGILGKTIIFNENGGYYLNQRVGRIKVCLDRVDLGFFHYITNTDSVRNQIKSVVYPNVQYNASTESIRNSFITLPPLSEQKQIADYLDRKTKQIDTLIEKKQKLIELLKEQRVAIINQAVTKGLDPNVPMKNSGIEWLGEIPEHWELKKIKYLLKNKKGALKTGPFGSQLKNSDLDDKGKTKVYNQRNVLDGDFDKGLEYVNEKKFEELKEFEVFENDILVTTRGTIGKCAIFPSRKQRGILHPCLIRIQVDQSLMCREWVKTYINESSYFHENVWLNSNATTIEVIYGITLREVLIPTPPKDEQKSILNSLSKKTTEIDESIGKEHKFIELLKEYRTTLISEAVTGKIDVRGEKV